MNYVFIIILFYFVTQQSNSVEPNTTYSLGVKN